jgi:hypothetical protein
MIRALGRGVCRRRKGVGLRRRRGWCRVGSGGVERESGEDEVEEEGVVRGWFAEKEGELEG